MTAEADLVERALASTGAVLGGVEANQMELVTPCKSFTVRGLVNHIIAAALQFATVAETGSGEPSDVDHASGGFEAEYNVAAVRIVEAFRDPATLERTMHLPFADLPASVFATFIGMELFAHGWDLAKALGQPTDLDPKLAGELLEAARNFVPADIRGPEGAPFGPIVEVDASASMADQLAGFMGRAV